MLISLILALKLFNSNVSKLKTASRIEDPHTTVFKAKGPKIFDHSIKKVSQYVLPIRGLAEERLR